jgi:hypothetical protein
MISIGLPEGEAEERHKISPIYYLLHSGIMHAICFSDLMDQHESKR